MLKKYIVFVVLLELIVFGLIITGIIPRISALGLGLALVIYAIMGPLEDTVILFIASIPLFLALPLTATFDNFNTWRVLAIIMFCRWVFQKETWVMLRNNISVLWHHHRQWHREHPHVTTLLTLLVIAGLSLIGSPDWKLGLKRILYFVNLSLVGVVAYQIARKNKKFVEQAIRAITIPTIIVIGAGFLQVISTYLIDIYQFMRIWGEGIQLREFGTTWSYIAVHVGNTWFAYYGDQLSLRVFSLFPDSHSFPQFVLLGVPALFALALERLIVSPERMASLKRMIGTRTRLSIVLVPAAFLIAILSGTRGIWAASVGVVMLAIVLIMWMRRKADALHTRLFKYLSLYLILFFMLFAVAYPIFVSPQFLVSKGDFLLFGQRLKSIIDFGETSNAQRILIWKKSIISIAHHPLLGVGIGNFPVVLGENLFLAKAGSSAHNIYLHIAAEMGIPALLIALWLAWKLLKKTYDAYITETNPIPMVYYGASLLFIPWVFLYGLTDVALFDERAFLLFVTTIALITGHDQQ